MKKIVINKQEEISLSDVSMAEPIFILKDNNVVGYLAYNNVLEEWSGRLINNKQICFTSIHDKTMYECVKTCCEALIKCGYTLVIGEIEIKKKLSNS